MKDFKRFFSYIVALALTYLGFLCMSIPYFFITIKNPALEIFELPIILGSYPANGYSALALWTHGWSGILVSILQILEIILMAVILIFAVIGILSEISNRATEQAPNYYLQKTMFLMILINLCLDFVVLVFVIVLTILNKFSLNAGLFLKLFFDGTAFVGLLLGRYFFRDKPLIKSRALSENVRGENRDD